MFHRSDQRYEDGSNMEPKVLTFQDEDNTGCALEKEESITVDSSSVLMAPPSVKIKHITRNSSGDSRFPKLDECAHFHYENVELGPIKVFLCEKQLDPGKLPLLGINTADKENELDQWWFCVQVVSNSRTWMVRRSYNNFKMLDIQLHRCVYDRKYSLLCELPPISQVIAEEENAEESIRNLLSEYLERFSHLAGSLISCGPVLNWLELDNRGNRLIVTDEAAINTPAVAAAYVVRRYTAQASDEISFEVGDMISVIDMPPPDESTWWRGKKGFETRVNDLNVICCYADTEDTDEEEKDRFYEQLQDILNSVKKGDITLVLGDFNAKVGTDSDLWGGVIGPFDIGNCNGNGQHLLQVGFFPCECIEVIGDKVPHSFKLSKSSATKPVFRKHGKLIAFFRSFLLSRPSRRKLKQSGILKERVFGCDLGEHLLNTGREIPLILKCCTEFIEECGIVDGIYRLSGVSSNIQRLRLAFDEDRAPNLGDPSIVQDIHSVASLLKMYFRELPNPLLTYQLYDKFVSAVQSDEDVRLLRLRDVVQQLPPPHYRTLEFLLKHLARVASHGNQTGMTPKNVAIVWAPNLLRSREVENGGVGALHVVGVQAVLTEYLIRYADLIFNEKMPVFHSSDLEEGTLLRARPKSLAISTPTKLLSLEEARSRALSAHLPPTQQKYIEVGGGPDNLPSKYHTVIDLPGGKRGCTKFKKSPSGWKSFFSRGWYSGSARDKGRPVTRATRKASTGSLQHSPLQLQDKARTESDVSYNHPKKLRTVKSAESLVHCGSGTCHSSSKDNSGSSRSSSQHISMDSSYSFELGSALSKSPSLHKHTRSSSHESYFEHSVDMESEQHIEDEQSIFHFVKETMQKIQQEAGAFVWTADDSGEENNFDPVIFSAPGCMDESSNNFTLNENSQLVPKGEVFDCEKVVRKQKLQVVDNDMAQAKVQRLSWMENESFSASLENNQSGELIVVSIPSVIDISTGVNARNFEHDLERFSYNRPATEDNFVWLHHKKQTVTDKHKTEDDGNELQLESSSFSGSVTSKGHSSHVTSDCEADVGAKTVVERYGNAETVIVEVHATQDSSSEGEFDLIENINDVFHDKSCFTDNQHENMFLHSDKSPSIDGNTSQVSEKNIMCNFQTPCNIGEFPVQKILPVSLIASGSNICCENHIPDDENEESPVKDGLNMHQNEDIAVFNSVPSQIHCNATDMMVTDIDDNPDKVNYSICPENSKNITKISLEPVENDQIIDSSVCCQENEILVDQDDNEVVAVPSKIETTLVNYEESMDMLHSKSSNLCTSSEATSTKENESDVAIDSEMKALIGQNKAKNKVLSCEISSSAYPHTVKLPPSPVFPQKSPKVQEIHSFRTKIENLPSPRKRQVYSIPSPSSPVEEVRKKFELKATPQKQNHVPEKQRADSETDNTGNKEIPVTCVLNERKVLERQNIVNLPPSDPTEKVKRKSDGIVLSAKCESVQNKRHSEPPVGTRESLSSDKTVKNLLFRFESQNSPVSHNNIIEKGTHPNFASKPKSAQPSLFTQLKVRKLQSLQSSSASVPSEPIDPWSDPILDMQEEYHVISPVIECNKSSESSVLERKINAVLDDSKNNASHPLESVQITPIESYSKKKYSRRKCNLESCDSTDDTPKIDKGSEYKETLVNDPSERLYEESIDLKEKCSLPNSKINSLSTVEGFSEPERRTMCSKLSDSNEDEATRRERIERIKEERRAQLRERLKSESFRLEAEEKEKVQTKFRLRKEYSRQTLSGATNELPVLSGENKKDSKMNEMENYSKSTSDIDHCSVDDICLISESCELTEHEQRHLISDSNLQENHNICHNDEKLTLEGYSPEGRNLLDAASKKQTELPKTTTVSKECFSQPKKSNDNKDSTGVIAEQGIISKRLSGSCSAGTVQKTVSCTKKPPSPKHIREKVAMFERSKDAKESCRSGPNGKFPQKQGASSLTPSFVR